MMDITTKVKKVETKQRDPYFQTIRGICMCTVILIHCQDKGHSVASEYYQIVLRQIINFAVATFVFMAGYFAHPYKMNGGGYLNRLKKTSVSLYFMEYILQRIELSYRFLPIKDFI